MNIKILSFTAIILLAFILLFDGFLKKNIIPPLTLTKPITDNTLFTLFAQIVFSAAALPLFRFFFVKGGIARGLCFGIGIWLVFLPKHFFWYWLFEHSPTESIYPFSLSFVWLPVLTTSYSFLFLVSIAKSLTVGLLLGVIYPRCEQVE